MTQDQLKLLRGLTDDAIGIVECRGNDSREAINWADLSCTQAEWILTDTGHTYAKVVIEEAAPECPVFHQDISDELSKLGWPDVTVETSW